MKNDEQKRSGVMVAARIVGHISDVIERRGLRRTEIGIVMDPEADRDKSGDRVRIIERREGASRVDSIVRLATAVSITSKNIIPPPTPWVNNVVTTRIGTAPALRTDQDASTRCAEATGWYTNEITKLARMVAVSRVGKELCEDVDRAAVRLGISKHLAHLIFDDNTSVADAKYCEIVDFFHRHGYVFSIW